MKVFLWKKSSLHSLSPFATCLLLCESPRSSRLQNVWPVSSDRTCYLLELTYPLQYGGGGVSSTQGFNWCCIRSVTTPLLLFSHSHFQCWWVLHRCQIMTWTLWWLHCFQHMHTIKSRKHYILSGLSYLILVQQSEHLQIHIKKVVVLHMYAQTHTSSGLVYCSGVSQWMGCFLDDLNKTLRALANISHWCAHTKTHKRIKYMSSLLYSTHGHNALESVLLP